MMRPSRRDLLRIAAGSVGAASLRAGTPAAPARKMKLGFDNFSIRAKGWKAGRLLEYARSSRLDSVLFSDLEVYESLDEAYLQDLKQQANELGVEIQAGTGSLCPTSATYQNRYGTAEEQSRLLLRVAHTLGSPVARCYLGNAQDRKGPGGIEAHVQELIRTLRKARGLAIELGVKFAIENHAGDMQAAELARLIERAGPEFVGATIDSGNATWTLEDPMENLETLGPYALTSGFRDSMVWETPEGAMVQWTAIGEGLVDFDAYLDRFARLCPGVHVQLEIISEIQRPVPFLRVDFWDGYETVPAKTLAGFARLARKGHPVEPARFPEGDRGTEARGEFQMRELERSVRYCKEVLGLGLRPSE